MGGALVEAVDHKGYTALFWCACKIKDGPDGPCGFKKDAALVLLEYGADPDHADSRGRSPRIFAPNVMRALLEDRERAVTTAAVASSIMSGLCGENTGSLLASFLATPWMLKQIKPMPWWVAFGAKLRA